MDSHALLAMLGGAMKLFGARRVVSFLALLVVLAVTVAFKSLAAITTVDRELSEA